MADDYTNPVTPFAFPDPFVLKHNGEYWGYCTGVQPDGGCFGLAYSIDLVNWKYLGSVMTPSPNEGNLYWAPEVVYWQGIFYLYYSVGDEENMSIRVATATTPQGPFMDSGRRLTQEKFAIDAHIFVDEDGKWYLFYATDFLNRTRVGTGTAMDGMLDPFTPAGKPHIVTAAQFDWQIYDPKRAWKGGVCWHTVEGSFVLKHNGTYYQMFSGGNWQNDSYGVGYGIAPKIDSEEEWFQPCDGSLIPPILKSKPGEGVIGPGHNSVVRGLDNRELFCVYHRWDQRINNRVMAMDRLDWQGDHLVVLGPSFTAQEAPQKPKFFGFEGFELTGKGVEKENSRLIMKADSETEHASIPMNSQPAIIEIGFELLEFNLESEISVDFLDGESRPLPVFCFNPSNAMIKSFGEVETQRSEVIPSVLQLFRIEWTQSGYLKLYLNQVKLAEMWLPIGLTHKFRLSCTRATVTWHAFTLTAQI